jgi:hypothetical protein
VRGSSTGEEEQERERIELKNLYLDSQHSKTPNCEVNLYMQPEIEGIEIWDFPLKLIFA